MIPLDRTLQQTPHWEAELALEFQARDGATRLTAGTIQLHDSIPGFQLVGGSVQLLPDFQGGAGITNLVLDGVTLSGTNTVTGTLTFRSGSLGGVLLIAPGATFSIEGGTGKTLSATVTNRGTFALSNATRAGSM